MNEVIAFFACLLGCYDGSHIYVNPALPEPIHSYVYYHESCHANHTNYMKAGTDWIYRYSEEYYCHRQALVTILQTPSAPQRLSPG
jgi:hypothetical protein